jgi:hypothetical protein
VWNDGVNYVFLVTMDAKMIAHPIKPALTKNDKLIETKDVTGKRFNVDMIEMAKKRQRLDPLYLAGPGVGAQQAQIYLHLLGTRHQFFRWRGFLSD